MSVAYVHVCLDLSCGIPKSDLAKSYSKRVSKVTSCATLFPGPFPCLGKGPANKVDKLCRSDSCSEES